MTQADRYGNCLSTTSAAARDACDGGLALFPGANHGEAAGRAYLDGWLADYDPRSVLHGHLVRHLTPVLVEAVRLGGSRAQRDLIELAYLHALLRLGEADETRR